MEPGAVITMGTNNQGLDAMRHGDRVEMEIQGLAKLTLNVNDPFKREWPKGIDQATADRAAGRTST